MSSALDISDALTAAQGYKETILAAMDLKGLEQRKDDVKSFDQDKEDLAVLCGEVDQLEERENELQRLHSEAQDTRERLADATQTFEELNVPLEYEKKKQKELFEKCFGLEFRITEDRAICLSFFNLNPDDPEQRFTITMDIENDQWKVVHMEPVLHGVRGLLSDLNGGGELKTFCKQIRQKFKDTLKETIN